MIPKKLHYIWLGGKPLPSLIEKCIKSWEKYCPGWEIKRWDETNLNIDINSYCRQAYDAKKYAFASDVLRFNILREHGGVYLDVDVELLKPLDKLLDNLAFGGFELCGEELSVAPGLICGSEPQSEVIKKICDIYDKDVFFIDGEINLETVCTKVTNLLKSEYGLSIRNEIQHLDGITIYPTEYFCPINPCTKEMVLTENTYSKHLYMASWKEKTKFITRVKLFIKRILRKIVGKKNYQKLKNKFTKKETENE